MIEKSPAASAADAADALLPRSGALMAKLAPDAPPEQMRPCPLKHTEVKASVAGYVASVDVAQQFQNPFGQKIEAVYVFPLPANAAVNEFLMTVGDRKIRGVVREREQARQIYESARSQGYVASLLTQDRPNVFTQAVANIEPGKQIDINVRYFHTLTYDEGWYELVFPMVVGPRFNPPGTSDGIGAVGTDGRGSSGQKTELSYLPPGTRTGHDIALAVDLDAGVAFEEVRSVNHKVAVARKDERHATVTLDPADSVPNKDFVLRWRVAGDAVKSGVVAVRDEKTGAGYFAMMVVPPTDLRSLPQRPMEYVFTLDVSGSMSGRPIAQAKAAMLYALRRLGPDDRFQVVKFDSNADLMAPAPVPATPANVARAARYVEGMEAGGGTMMLDGMRNSLDFPRDPSRLRVVAFLTDGYIGNETEVLRAMHGWLGDARVFSFGVGQSTNRYLLDSMAKLGQGAAAYVSLNEDPEPAMAAFFERARHPAMTNLALDFGGDGSGRDGAGDGAAKPRSATAAVTAVTAVETFPRKIPDLFVGRPVIVTGKFAGEPPRSVRLTGTAFGESRAIDVPVARADVATAKALPAVWARAKIADLADEAIYRPDAARGVPQGVRQVALEYGLMSSFTSFVAVDASRRTDGDHGVSTRVPVPVPDGVRYDTTVPEGQPAGAREAAVRN